MRKGFKGVGQKRKGVGEGGVHPPSSHPHSRIVASFPGSVSIQGVSGGTDDVIVAEKEDVLKLARMSTRLLG